MSRRAAAVAVVALAAIAAFAPMSPDIVERWYATGLYPVLQRAITPLSNSVPVAIFDLLVAGAVVIAIRILFQGVRTSRGTKRIGPIVSALGRLVTAAAAAYLVFLIMWGLNYRRLPMSERLDVRPGTIDSEAVLALGLDTASHLNRLYEQTRRDFKTGLWGGGGLPSAFADTQRTLSDTPLAVPGRLKLSFFGPYFRWASIDGMTNPFALEVLANPDLLPWEQQFVAAHEWAHLAGYAHEAEANFVGFLTCVRGPDSAQYSGWLFLYWQIADEVSPHDRAALGNALAPGPRRDLEAIADRIRRGQFPFLRNTGWAMYDQYLRANRVEGGVRSYGEVVNLILRTRFEEGWKPVRRNAASSER